uniref:Odorant receptor n=1 Tax=Glossina brevipalpis TaxID=37001 RepID=A0A1A9WA50_9MUSC
MFYNRFTSITSFNSFVDRPKQMLKYSGIKLDKEEISFYKMYTFLVIITIMFAIISQLWYVASCDASDPHRVIVVVYSAYFMVDLGKMVNILYRQSSLIECLAELQDICPDKDIERKYKLQHYLKSYKRVENFFYYMVIFLVITFSLDAIARSLLQLYLKGSYGYLMTVVMRPAIPYEDSLLIYISYFVLSTASGTWVAINIIAIDLCLLGCVLQLCLHFELLSKQLMELDPSKLTELEAIKKLNSIAKHHNELIGLSRKINRTFSGSMICNLMAASFVLCFLCYQMLGDVQFLDIVKTILLLLNESKQVLLICYCGDRLSDSSQLFNDSLYMHNWVDGSVRYQHHLLFMILYAHKPVMLNLLGLIDITLITLKEVYGAAYRFFTVLKTT